MHDIKIEDVLLEKIKPNEYNPKGKTEKEKKELKNSGILGRAYLFNIFEHSEAKRD